MIDVATHQTSEEQNEVVAHKINEFEKDIEKAQKTPALELLGQGSVLSKVKAENERLPVFAAPKQEQLVKDTVASMANPTEDEKKALATEYRTKQIKFHPDSVARSVPGASDQQINELQAVTKPVAHKMNAAYDSSKKRIQPEVVRKEASDVIEERKRKSARDIRRVAETVREMTSEQLQAHYEKKIRRQQKKSTLSSENSIRLQEDAIDQVISTEKLVGEKITPRDLYIESAYSEKGVKVTEISGIAANKVLIATAGHDSDILAINVAMNLESQLESAKRKAVLAIKEEQVSERSSSSASPSSNEITSRVYDQTVLQKKDPEGERARNIMQTAIRMDQVSQGVSNLRRESTPSQTPDKQLQQKTKELIQASEQKQVDKIVQYLITIFNSIQSQPIYSDNNFKVLYSDTLEERFIKEIEENRSKSGRKRNLIIHHSIHQLVERRVKISLDPIRKNEIYIDPSDGKSVSLPIDKLQEFGITNEMLITQPDGSRVLNVQGAIHYRRKSFEKKAKKALGVE